MPNNNPNQHVTQDEKISLEKHFNVRIDNLEKYLEKEIRNVRDGISAAKIDNDARLAGMNEFREQLKDQASRFVTRAEMLAVAAIISGLVSSFIIIFLRFIKTY